MPAQVPIRAEAPPGALAHARKGPVIAGVDQTLRNLHEQVVVQVRVKER